MEKEIIQTQDFLKELKSLDEDFADICKDESAEYAVLEMRDYLGDKFPWHKKWNYKFIDVVEKKGDGYEEMRYELIFQRKSDKKCFAMNLHDDGGIGGNLHLSEYLYEVKSTKKTKTTWN